MTLIYNRAPQKPLRQLLRNGAPKAEQILWQKLKGKQLNGLKFRRQYGVGRYVIDFYCTQLKLAIEIDGPSHFEKGAREYDQERQRFIQTFGISFIRFTNEQIYRNLPEVLRSIAQKADSMVG